MTAAWQSFAATSVGLGNDPVVTKPSGTVDGDLLIAVGKASGTDTITAPAGWNVHSASLGSNLPLWTKVASGEPANYTFVVTGTANSVVVIARVNGQHASTPVDVASGVNVAGGTANHVIPSVTTTGSNRLLLQICARLVNTSYTPPGTATERWDNQAATGLLTTAGGDEVVGTGATGSRTWTSASSSGGAVGYMLAITPASQTVSPGGIDSTATIGAPTVTPGAVTVSPGGVNSAATVGTPTVTAGAVTVSPGGINSTATVGAPTVTAGPVTVSPSGIDSTTTVGAPTVLPGAVTVSPTGIDSAALVGDPTVVPGSFTVEPAGIDSTALLGTPTVVPGGFTVSPPGIGPTSAVGEPTILRQPFVTATVYDHETGLPVGAGAVVQLFDADGTLLDTTVTDAGGVYWFFLPFGFTDDVFTVVRVDIGGVEYQGVSEICPVQT